MPSSVNSQTEMISAAVWTVCCRYHAVSKTADSSTSADWQQQSSCHWKQCVLGMRLCTICCSTCMTWSQHKTDKWHGAARQYRHAACLPIGSQASASSTAMCRLQPCTQNNMNIYASQTTLYTNKQPFHINGTFTHSQHIHKFVFCC